MVSGKIDFRDGLDMNNNTNIAIIIIILEKMKLP